MILFLCASRDVSAQSIGCRPRARAWPAGTYSKKLLNLFSVEGLLIADKTLFSRMRSSQWVTATLISLVRGRGYLMRVSVVAACLSLCLIGFSAADDARASIRKETNIPAEGLGPALNALAKDRNFQIVYVTEEIANVHTNGAVGEFTTEEALKRLLNGTGLTYRYLDDKTVTIGFALTPHERSGQASTSSRSSDDTNANQEGKKSFWDSFRLAQANQGTPQRSFTVGSDAQSTSGSSGNSPGMNEIVVTAQKKSERLQDVPIPISVINTDALADTNQVLLQDYYSSVPGVSVQPGPFGAESFAIRGIGTGGVGAPTTGITIDDVPFGSSSDWSGGGAAIDFDPGDLDHIEVLRGPQGTLYGANSEGGLIKFVTKDPSTAGYSGRAEVGASGVQNGAERGYSMRASANIPVDDTLALRISGFTRQDPGYVDDPTRNLTGVNEAQVYGGRASMLWTPTESISLKLGELYQRYVMDGSSEVMVGPGFSGLQNSLLPGLQGDGIEETLQAYSAVLKVNLGAVKLTSLTGFNETHAKYGFDYSAFEGYPGGPAQQYFGVTGSGFISPSPENTFTQELRFSGSIGQAFDWLVGGFYKQDRLHDTNAVTAANSDTGLIVGYLGTFEGYTRSSTEYAGFTDLTYHVTDRFDIQLGGRESHDRIDVPPSIGTTPSDAGGPATTDYPGGTASANTFTYLFTPQWKLSQNTMVYARAASGFRPGGPNSNTPAATAAGAPVLYGPDKSDNYEVGFKGDFLNRRLSIDASVYHIKWSQIQISVELPNHNFGFIANGGNAKSDGVELSVEARPLSGLTLSGWVSYDNAELSQDLPPSAVDLGLKGDRIPFAPRIAAHLSAQDDFQIGQSTTAFVGADTDFQGNRMGAFVTVGDRQYYPSYTKLNLRIGVKHETWQASLYANNVADTRGVLNGGIGLFTPSPNNVPSFYYITPRTVGVTIVKSF
jgi:iron complex outermembrane receptor protein